MPRIVHLSDLHFGAHDERLVEAVRGEVDRLKPDLVVISGDFTQRARTEQFREACQFPVITTCRSTTCCVASSRRSRATAASSTTPCALSSSCPGWPCWA